MSRKVFIEDCIDFQRKSKTYNQVVQHRKNCDKWTKGFCLDCFGGGLTQFTQDLDEERTKNKKENKKEN